MPDLHIDTTGLESRINASIEATFKRTLAERPTAQVDKLLLAGPDASATCSISQKTLWNETVPRGDLPCVRIGSRVLYDVDDLRAWIARRKEVL